MSMIGEVMALEKENDELRKRIDILRIALEEIIDKEEPGLCNHRGKFPCCIAWRALEKLNKRIKDW